jgi:S-adenosylmethionine decarboxylase
LAWAVYFAGFKDRFFGRARAAGLRRPCVEVETLRISRPGKGPQRAKVPHPFDGPVDYLGRQVTVDFFDCDKHILNDPGEIEALLVAAAKAGKATVVKSLFHKFNPYGVSGVIVIAESHLAIHTWPEYGFASVDIFTCGPVVDPRVCQRYLVKALRSVRSEYHEFKRGILRLEGLTHKSVAVQGMQETPAALAPDLKGHRPKALGRKRRSMHRSALDRR